MSFKVEASSKEKAQKIWEENHVEGLYWDDGYDDLRFVGEGDLDPTGKIVIEQKVPAPVVDTSP